MKYSLYEARVTNKFSQKEVSEALGITVVTWRKFEVDNPKKISFELLEPFLNMVNLTVDQIDFTKV